LSNVTVVVYMTYNIWKNNVQSPKVNICWTVQ